MIRPDLTTLYKHLPFNEKSLSILINRKVWFADPKSFNDPFDCGCELNVKKLISKALLRYDNYDNLEQSQIQEIYRNCKEHPVTKNVMEMIRKTGLFSLSETYNEILMWSHYADSHKGFCIGFERSKANILGDDSRTFQVEYIDKTAVIDADQEGNFAIKSLIRKSDRWEYEQEWRCIKINSPDGETYFNAEGLDALPGRIESITFGLKMVDVHKRTIINILGDDVDYYRVEKDRKQFKLNPFMLTKEEVAALQKG